jgi:type IV pilus assembly protein PilV
MKRSPKPNLPSRKTHAPARERGVAMMEVLVSMLVIALWLLGSAGMQAGMFKLQKSAGSRLTAMALATELSESMQANLGGAKAGSYALAADATLSGETDCTAQHCSSTDLAAYDLRTWKSRVTSNLSTGAANVAYSTASGLPTYTITISWAEPRGRQTYSSAGNTETATFVITKVL